MLQRALLIAFFRGVGGGLSLAAVPYLLAGGGWSLRFSGYALRGVKLWFKDANDAMKFYEELRHNRRYWKANPPHEEDGLDMGVNQ